MELRVNEALDFLGIKIDTWKRANKEELFRKIGYNLICVDKRGRNNFYIIEEDPSEEGAYRREVFLKYGFKINSDNVGALFGFIFAIRNNHSSYINMSELSNELGVSRATLYNWRDKLERSGAIRVGDRDLVVKYHTVDNQEVGTEEDWAAWTKFVQECSIRGYHNKMAVFRYETGYFLYRSSSIVSDAFFGKFLQNK